MSICDECQSFRGHHAHSAIYHPTFCTCDGSDQSRRPVVDEGVMMSIRLADLTDQSDELDGVYTGKDALKWRAITRRLVALWRD